MLRNTSQLFYVHAAKIINTPVVWLLFVSLRDEIDLSALHQWLQQRHMQYLIPHVMGQDLIFSPVQMPHCSPSNNAVHSRCDVSQCCTLLVPGLAFDRVGNRLGRGKGFYDRFLSALYQKPNRPLVIGVCMQYQLVKEVPMQPHDQTVDAICTPQRGIFLLQQQSKQKRLTNLTRS